MIETFVTELMLKATEIITVRFLTSKRKEKQDYVTFIIKLTQSPIYDPESTVKYALIKQVEEGKCYPKIYYFYRRLLNEENLLSDYISKSSKNLRELLVSIRDINSAMIHYVENLNDEECKEGLGVEDEELRLNIDLYRWFVATLAIQGLKYKTKSHTSTYVRLNNIIELTKYSLEYIEY